MPKRRRQEEERPLPLRVVIRSEGEWWIAYLARPDTLEDAHEIGRILLNAVRLDPQIGQDFKVLMTHVLTGTLANLGAKVVHARELAPVKQPEPSD